MSERETELRRQLNAKTREIERLVASTLSLGDINDLDHATLHKLEQDVEHMIEDFEEADNEGDSAEEWQARDRRLAQTEIGRLMQERHEIAEQILDLGDPDSN